MPRDRGIRVVMDDTLPAMLAHSVVFGALEADERQQLAARGHRRRIASETSICRAGDPGDSMMIVLKGSVRVSLTTPAGRDIILGDLSEGDIFGEIALLDGRPRSADITALTNCELMVFDRGEILPLLTGNAAFSIRLIQLLCARLRLADERMTDIGFLGLRSRLAKLLVQRTGPQSGGRPPRLSLSQGEIADMIGGARENVNRQLREWHARGIVDMKAGWILVVDRAALDAMAR